MIRFLIGCLLAIAVLWASLLTVAPILMGFAHHRTCIKWAAQ